MNCYVIFYRICSLNIKYEAFEKVWVEVLDSKTINLVEEFYWKVAQKVVLSRTGHFI